MLSNISLYVSILGLTGLLSQPQIALAQEYPTKAITVVVSYAAGGNNDLRARQLGVPVGAALGKSVIIDNKPGASGNWTSHGTVDTSKPQIEARSNASGLMPPR
jgi:tripartite-type tricarboxylate transporter receptor subunit TctC